MLATIAARLSEIERRFELLRRQFADLQALMAQLQQRTAANRAPNQANGEDRLAKSGGSIAAGASGSLTYYQQGSVTTLTSPAETITASNPHPTAAVPAAATCIVGVANGLAIVKGWFCSLLPFMVLPVAMAGIGC